MGLLVATVPETNAHLIVTIITIMECRSLAN